jgi:NADPH-dependent 2,4-dienoyl-CoA reductase/sulfur reductase-like enzyme
MSTRRLLIIGGSDGGIMAALRARELDPDIDVTVMLADAYPNFSICGLPYLISGEVGHWRNLAHRTTADLEATGMTLALDTTAERIAATDHQVLARTASGDELTFDYDKLIVATGAVSARPPIAGLDRLGVSDGLHLLHTMGDAFAVQSTIEHRQPESAIIVGAGYIGLEMAEGLTTRGLQVTVIERLPEVLPTVDPQLGEVVRQQLTDNGVKVMTNTAVSALTKLDNGNLCVHTADDACHEAGLVLVVTGVKPDVDLAVSAGATLGYGGAIAVDRRMQTGAPDIYAAGDCVHTHHRLMPAPTYLPLGTTAHKQGRVAGENAIGGDTEFAGSLGTQVVKIFELVAARTGLKDIEATAAGYRPHTTAASPDDHKAYYPGSHPIDIRVTGDTTTGRLLGAQLVGHRHSEIAKRVDTYATALFHEMTAADVERLDLSYTPPLGSPYDAVQVAAQRWVADQRALSAPT